MITTLITVITCIVSIIAFQNRNLMGKMIFYPTAITYNKEWYRFISSGFVHAGWEHLIFNMLSFYSFSKIVEMAFVQISGNGGEIIFLVFYLTALIASSIPDYVQNKTNNSYASLGASGAVSAIVFASILINPLSKIYLMFIPIGIPAFLFGILFIAISLYLDKRGGGNINHRAHIFGAIYGLAFFTIYCQVHGIAIITNFLHQITG